MTAMLPVLVSELSTRILEVHLGSVTEAALALRPELRERVGRGWSREHYQSHRRERNHQFTHEIVRVLDDVMSTGGYGHLILAGTPKLTALLREALPKRIAAKLIDVVPTSVNDRTSDVVAATLESFVEQEQQESLAAVEKLRNEICRHGLAVAGPGASLQALRARQVDLLVMATEYAPEPAWICTGCDTTAVAQPRPEVCPKCGCAGIRDLDLKEELARLAEIARCGVEIVHDSESLMRLGGCRLSAAVSAPGRALPVGRLSGSVVSRRTRGPAGRSGRGAFAAGPCRFTPPHQSQAARARILRSVPGTKTRRR